MSSSAIGMSLRCKTTAWRLELGSGFSYKGAGDRKVPRLMGWGFVGEGSLVRGPVRWPLTASRQEEHSQRQHRSEAARRDF